MSETSYCILAIVSAICFGTVLAILCSPERKAGHRPEPDYRRRVPPQGGLGTTGWPSELVELRRRILQLERERDEERDERQLFQKHFRHAMALAARLKAQKDQAEMWAEAMVGQCEAAAWFPPATRRAFHEQLFQ